MTQREIIGKTPHTMRLLLAIALAIIMIAGGFVVLASSQPTATSPTATAAATTASILPNPTMNTNITSSTFYSGWNPLEYSNGSANLTLNTGLSQYYENPITVNPAGIQSSALQGKIGNLAWNDSANWNTGGGSSGNIGTSGSHIYTSVSSLDTGIVYARHYMNISEAYLPSANPAYDYISILGSVKETGQVTGDGFYLTAANSSNTNFEYGAQITNGTAKLANAPVQTGQWFISAPLSLYMKNIGNGYVWIGITAATPETATNGSNVQNLSILGMSLTTSPMTLGSFVNNTGSHPVSAMANGFTLNQFSPDFAWSKITNDSYTVATSQPLQDTIISQTAINQNGYSEQVSYQGTEYLPTAPYLTYTNTNISMPMNISGSQFTIANLNGVSYLSAIQAKHNGTFLFALVNPNQQNSIILQVDYTTAQWNSVSGAPPFFSLAGIEYYWWVGLIGFFSLIGLGSAALAHWGGEEENLRTPKGKFGR